MKKHYIGIIAIAISSSGFTQTLSPIQQQNTSKFSPTKSGGLNYPALEKGNKAIHFSEDFESGSFPPTGWAVSSGTNSTITVPADQAWHESTNGNPSNCASITWLNGVDVHDEWLESPALDLSAMGTNMRLEFDFNTSQYWHVTPNDNGDIWVKISFDGGTTYTDTLFVEDDPALLAAALVDVDWLTYTWTPARIDISAYAAETNVVFAWHYEAQDGAQYHVDNISIVDIEPNDLSMNGHWHETVGLPYYQIPTTQVQPINFSAELTNLGTIDQTNTMLTVDVNGGTYTGTSTANMLTVGSSDSLYVTNPYTPTASVGTHTVTWSVGSDFTDDAPGDNTATETLEVTDGLYARDKGVYDGESGGEDEATPGDFAFEAGNLYDIFFTEQFCGIQTVIGSNTPAGTIIYGKIYELDGTGNFVYVDETAEYTTTQSDADNNVTITLVLFTYPTLTAGSTYLPVVGCYSEFYYGTSGYSEDQTSFIMYPTVGGSGSQYFTNNTPIVRLFNDPSCWWSVSENTNSSLQLNQNQPNPFNSTTEISYTVKSNSSVNLTVVDMTGKVVLSLNEGTKAAGDHSIELDASKLAEGLYQYTLSNGEVSITKSMSVIK